MRKADFSLEAIRNDARITAYAESAAPAWLWTRDGTRILWANAAGLNFFNAQSEDDLAGRTFGPADRYRRLIARLAGQLPISGAPRLERLQGFGAVPGLLMTCAFSRIAFGKNAGKDDYGVLVAAAQAPGRRAIKQTTPIPVVTAAPVQAAALPDEPAFAEPMTPPGVVTGPAPAETIAAAGMAGSSSSSLPPTGKPFPMDQLTDESILFPDPSAPSMPTDSDAEPAPTLTDAPAGADVGLRHDPLRFTWQMDADGHFSFGSDEFMKLIGARTAAAFGRSWSDINAALHLDPDDRLTLAMARHDAFGGIILQWPADDFGERLPVEMSGLPLFDREHQFAGYRGFAICRDLEALSRIAAQRAHDTLFGPIGRDNSPDIPNKAVSSPLSPANREAQGEPENHMDETREPPVQDLPIQEAPAQEAPVQEAPVQESLIQESPVNVVPFRSAGGDAKGPALTPGENNAFQEIARQLAQRLENEAGRLLGERNPETLTESTVAQAPGERIETIEDLLADEPPQILARPAMRSLARHAPLFDHLPLGVLVYQLDRLLYANQAFLDATGYRDLSDLAKDGGLEALYVTSKTSDTAASEAGTPVSIATRRMASAPGFDAKLHAIDWDGDNALAVILSPQAAAAPAPQAPEPRPAPAETETPRIVERVASAKADLLARISHDVRTPVNAIIGFADVMIEERFGPLGNERYIDYMKDIRASGERVIAIVDEMLDLTRIESGKLDLAFTNQDLNTLIEQCVAVMQPQANRERIIIRSSLTHGLPNVHADAQALRQIALNLIGCSIHLANAGGQVIVSTAMTDLGGIALRIRDTGHGLNDNEIAAAMAPFRTATPPTETSLEGSANLSMTKALVEANRGRFNIKSAPNAGTLIEVVFDQAKAG